MFWGLNLKANRKYSQTTNKSFHISQAALDSESSDGGTNEIYISCGNQKFLICTLRKDVCEQVMLDFNFAEGDKISFQSKGSGNVTLTGYIVNNMDFMNGDDEDSESEEENNEELNVLKGKKNKIKRAAALAAMLAKDNSNDDGDEEEEDDEDYVAGEDDEDIEQGEDDDEGEDDDDENEGLEEDDDDDEDDDDEDEDDEDEDADSDDEPTPQPQVKKAKLEKPQKQQNGVAKEAPATADKKKQKNKEKKQENQNKQQQQQPKQQKQGGERVLSGGVKVEDIRVGNGPEVTNHKRVQVYYEGRLKANNKVFDSLKTGNGFKFTVGRSEVIKAWDIGLIGMKVGGKRRIVCPPHMAYGARGSPPAIPPNSTLVFEVELKAVN